MTVQQLRKKMTYVSMFALSVLIVGSYTTSEVYAWHDLFQPVMTPSDRQWKCIQFTNVDVRNGVDICSEIQKADNTWNNVANSDFDLIYTAAGTYPIHVQGDDPTDDAYLAETFQVKSGSVLVGADMDWDEDSFCFNDTSASGHDTSCWDIQSVAAHEFGHMQWVGESTLNSDSLMEPSIAANTERHNVEQHDIDVLAARH
jgi:hypothetical protein